MQQLGDECYNPLVMNVTTPWGKAVSTGDIYLQLRA